MRVQMTTPLRPWISFVGGLAVLGSIILLWLFRPETQVNHVMRLDILLPSSLLMALGIILILFGWQHQQRQTTRLARSLGIYLLLGVIFSASVFGSIAITESPLSALLAVQSLGLWASLSIALWPMAFILYFNLFGYGFY